MTKEEAIEKFTAKRFVMLRNSKIILITKMIRGGVVFFNQGVIYFDEFSIDFFSITDKKAIELLGQKTYDLMLKKYPEIEVI